MEDSSEGISRRKLLKRGAAGAAVVWTAPILTSMRTSAFAATQQCVTFDCNNLCQQPGGCDNPLCPCGPFTAVSDGCFCASHYLPGVDCASDSDCPPFEGLSPGRCVPSNNCGVPHECLYCTQTGSGQVTGLKQLR
jgi:hypothetical protein